MTKKYVQGKSIEAAQEASGLKDVLKVGSNENVLGPSPKAIEAIRSAAPETHLYPDDHANVLQEKLAARIGGGLNSENFITGNGSCDVLRMIVQTFIRPGKKALIAAPTFGMYQILVEMFGGEAEFVPLNDFTVDLDHLLQAVTPEVSLIFVCNPNNPTGTFVTHDQLARFLDQVPAGVVTICDEAYMEFATDPKFPRVTELIAEGHDLLVSRTFSKLHGLASMRVGYGFGRADLIAQVRGNQLHFNSGRIAYLAASAAVNDEAHIAESLEMVDAGRKQYYAAFDEMRIGYLPSQSNFIFLTHLPIDANKICDEALKMGIILRPTNPFGLPDNIRITIARQEENQRVITALQQIVGG